MSIDPLATQEDRESRRHPIPSRGRIESHEGTGPPSTPRSWPHGIDGAARRSPPARVRTPLGLLCVLPVQGRDGGFDLYSLGQLRPSVRPYEIRRAPAT